ncbi:uncharacterized protein EI90DRAFT_3139120 [Cantharellus anzutake]|uniref:uncharacterized protein n=1 Tax=Cantharellus anzutake TaxID=1750568 RepID=UPI001906E747|nr:uncharacterized protein EI90DRAFT_3139120 [Cantharellus anzutake]KAF8310814.1 hypothetical protein EI90DRAFT_3139120 [Cantharellus anzutake]
MKYGQDLELDTEDLERTITNFDERHSFEHISRWSFALASHLRWAISPSNLFILTIYFHSARVVEHTEAISPTAIVATYGEVFDEFRQRIDELEDLPYEDEDGNPIEIYDTNGNIIQRKTAFFREEDPTGGILIKLDSVHAMFDRIYGNHRQSDPHRTGNVVTRIYPQAFMTSFGHVQSTTVFPEFHQTAQSVNRQLLSQHRGRGVAENDDDDEFFRSESSSSESSSSDDNYMPSPSTIDGVRAAQNLMQQHAVEPLKGVFFQAYNLLQHRIARRSGDAETMHGTVTAALAGHHAQPHERATVERHQSYVDIGMPFDRMKTKLTSDTILPPTDLRLENYWMVNFAGIAKEKRTGRWVFNHIITPLLDAWVEPTLIEKLKQHTVIFKPHFLQRVYLWTTYPLFWAVDHIYQCDKAQRSQGHKPDPLLRELVAALERAGSFGFCGAGKVLSTQTMDPLLLSIGIKETGFPCLSEMIGFNAEADEKIRINASQWPCDADGIPRFASKRVVLFHYSQGTYDKLVATCFIEHIQKGIKFLAPDTLSTQMRTICSLASYAVDSLEKDALYAVEKGIKDSIKGLFPHADREQRHWLRQQAEGLKTLCASLHPFDNSKEATQQLLLALCSSPQAIHSALKNLPKMDVHEWVRHIYAMVSPPAPHVPGSSRTLPRLGAPFFRQGSSAVIFTQVFDALREICDQSDWRAQRDFCVEAIVAEMASHRIFRYPMSGIILPPGGQPYGHSITHGQS